MVQDIAAKKLYNEYGRLSTKENTGKEAARQDLPAAAVRSACRRHVFERKRRQPVFVSHQRRTVFFISRFVKSRRDVGCAVDQPCPDPKPGGA